MFPERSVILPEYNVINKKHSKTVILVKLKRNMAKNSLRTKFQMC